MIKMIPVNDAATLADMNRQCGVEVAAKSGYCLYEDDKINGFILYNVTHDYGEIIAVNAANDTYVDGLVRAVLGSLYDIGIDKAGFGEKVDKILLEKIDILVDGKSEITSISRLINGCSGCRGCGDCR